MKTDRIAGGTNTAGVDDAVFAMPAGMAIRYDRPAAALADYITGYHVYRSDTGGEGQVDWFLPATANVRIAIDAGPIAVSIGRRTYDPLPSASLFGPTNQALKAVTHGGVMIGFGISALGWARLFRRSAADFRNRIVPLEDVLGKAFTRDVVAALQGAPDDAAVAPILDALLLARLGRSHADAPQIRQLMEILATDGPTDITSVAAQLEMPTHALRRLAVRHFGFPPKMLLLRARFLRSFVRLMTDGGGADYTRIDRSYFDASHFLRDSATFLGMTPRRFMALTKPFLDASLRARNAVLGSPTQVLHDIETAPARDAQPYDSARPTHHRVISQDGSAIGC
ncbi:hypothetical protein HMP09_0120 [Sphingomonas sp. HMP9]|uniref:helix-turn-helix domain-containing protein n=1 Tax=Sphingomonas sp. HMP9 TaxID=1517554 RepID=UPI0015967B1A|nr:helix-turn-helix domain-containing protein [Sphingomonas sp. HMP9]BCA60886.1 hypothetical protein HMP09_0120 [Sphingomonas sp. HMP9]